MNREAIFLVLLGAVLLPVAALALTYDSPYTGMTAGMVGILSVVLGIAEYFFKDE